MIFLTPSKQLPGMDMLQEWGLLSTLTLQEAHGTSGRK